MIDKNYIIIKSEEDDVKVITNKSNHDSILEILKSGEVLILNLNEDIVNFKVKGRARIVSKLDQVMSE